MDDKEKYQSLFEHTPIAIFEFDYSEFKKYLDGLRRKGISNFDKYFKSDKNIVALMEDNKINNVLKDLNQAALKLYSVKDKQEFVERIEETLVPIVEHQAHMDIIRRIYTALSKNLNPCETEATIQTIAGNVKRVQLKIYIPPGFEDTWSRIYFAETDITEVKQNAEKVMSYGRRLRMLSKKIITAQEEERSKIALELHDQLGQELISARLEALSLAKQSKDDVITQRATDLAEILTMTANKVQQMSLEIRPALLHSLGFVRAIKQCAKDFEKRTGILCTVRINSRGTEFDSLGDSANTAFRIAQEALTNILKHSQATQAEINVNKEKDRIVLSVSDNGKGIDKRKLKSISSIGLLGMSERAKIIGGSLGIRTNPQKGTEIIARLPIPKQ
jgi:signal transduction histidine kinase